MDYRLRGNDCIFCKDILLQDVSANYHCLRVSVACNRTAVSSSVYEFEVQRAHQFADATASGGAIPQKIS